MVVWPRHGILCIEYEYSTCNGMKEAHAHDGLKKAPHKSKNCTLHFQKYKTGKTSLCCWSKDSGYLGGVTTKKLKGFCEVGHGLFFFMWVLATQTCSVCDNLLSGIFMIWIFMYVYIHIINCTSISLCVLISISLLHLIFLIGWWQSWQRFVPLLPLIDLSRMRILRLWLLFYLEWLIQVYIFYNPCKCHWRTRVACSVVGICPSFSLQVEGVIWIASKHTSEARLFFG